MKQLQFSIIPHKQPQPEKAERRKWRKKMQAYCDRASLEDGERNGWCMCGFMNYCDLCNGSDMPNACVNAIVKYAKSQGKTINFKEYDFRKFLEEL